MPLQQQQSKFANDVNKLLKWMFDHGYEVTFGETYRTKEQAEIYAKSGKGIINSLHCKKLAIDLNLFLKGKLLETVADYTPAGKYWESLDKLNRAGCFFKTRPDADHFERQEAL